MIRSDRGRRASTVAAACLSLLLLLLAWVGADGGGGLGEGNSQGVWSGVGRFTQPAVPAARQASRVAIIPIDGKLSRFMAVSVQRRLAQAAEAGADAVVIELKNAEAQLGAVFDVLDAVKNSPVPNTVAWVRGPVTGPKGVVALACREIVADGQATLGDLLPRPRSNRSNTNHGSLATQLFGEALEAAQRRGWDELIVWTMAFGGDRLWLVEETATGRRMLATEAEVRAIGGATPAAQTPDLAPVTDSKSTRAWLQSGSGSQSIPSSQRTPLTQADAGKYTIVKYATSGERPVALDQSQLQQYGLSVRGISSDEEIATFFGAGKVVRLEMAGAERIAEFLNQPVVRGVLIAVFLLAMLMELSQVGTFVPGAIAACSLILLIAPGAIAGLANWWALASVVLGVILIVIEIVVIPGFGIPGVVGLVLLFAGLVFTFVPGGSQVFGHMDNRDTLAAGLVTVVLSAATAVFAFFYVMRHVGTIPLLEKYILRSPTPEETGDSVLRAMEPPPSDAAPLGAIGRTATPLGPAGRALFGDIMVDVVAQRDYIDADVAVRVVSVDGLRIEVVRADEPPPAQRNA